MMLCVSAHQGVFMLFLDELMKCNDNSALASAAGGLPDNVPSLGRMMTGGSKAGRERRENDFYPTEPEPIMAFIEAEKQILDFFRWNKIRVWECACGDGAISRQLEGFGVEVLSTDLIYRGYGQGGVNFLTTSGPIKTPIITNPPYGDLPRQFIEHAIEKLEVPYLALLLKVNFFHTKTHHELFERHPYAREYRIPWRLDFTGEGKPTMTFSWFIWDFISPRLSTIPETSILRKPKISTDQRELFS